MDSTELLRRLYVAPPEVGQDVVQEFPLFLAQIPGGLFFQHGNRIDGMLGEDEVLPRLTGLGIRDLTDVQEGG